VVVIPATFERLQDVSVDRLFGATGVYVLWTANAKARPTYIGEGYLLDRFGCHVPRFGDGLIGSLAILGYDETWRLKEHAQIVEHLLLGVADSVDRKPAQNKSPGINAGVQKVFRRHGVLRVRIEGVDPLRDPTRPSSRLTEPKLIELRDVGLEGPDLYHDWNRRAR
jgi:hypothetical protein